jgi:hypothetical protein
LTIDNLFVGLRPEAPNLLAHIKKAEGDADWSDIEELRERAALSARIAKAEEP